ncbi:MAG: hypothetical protein JO023_23880 [Chloroflexi bacterium]|nr:hypothetical protein [Chloroflexota bacterium]
MRCRRSSDGLHFTSPTQTAAAIIERELELVRRRGYATDYEEFMLGLCWVAVPLYDATDQVVAISPG